MSKYVLKFARPYLHTKCVKKKKNGKMLHDPNDGNIALTEIHNSKYRYIYKVKNTTKICYWHPSSCYGLSSSSKIDISSLYCAEVIKPNLWRQQMEGLAKNISSSGSDIWRKEEEEEEEEDVSECEREDTGWKKETVSDILLISASLLQWSHRDELPLRRKSALHRYADVKKYACST